MSETSSYGVYYRCVKVAKTLSKNGEIYLHAERVVLDRVVCENSAHRATRPRGSRT